MEVNMLDEDGVCLHCIPPLCAALERYGRIPLLNTDNPVTPTHLHEIAYYAVKHLLPPFGIEYLTRDIPALAFARNRGRVTIAVNDYDSDYSLPLMRVVWTHARQHAWIETPEDTRREVIRLWKKVYSTEEHSVNKSYISDYRALGLLPRLPGQRGRALCWKGVQARGGRYYGVMGAPYAVGQEYIHPGAMACCGPFGAVEYTNMYIIAIAGDVRVPPDPALSKRGVVYAETGETIALYRVSAYDWRDGTVDLQLIESSVPYNPLYLL